MPEDDAMLKNDKLHMQKFAEKTKKKRPPQGRRRA